MGAWAIMQCTTQTKLPSLVYNQQGMDPAWRTCSDAAGVPKPPHSKCQQGTF